MTAGYVARESSEPTTTLIANITVVIMDLDNFAIFYYYAVNCTVISMIT